MKIFLNAIVALSLISVSQTSFGVNSIVCTIRDQTLPRPSDASQLLSNRVPADPSPTSNSGRSQPKASSPTGDSSETKTIEIVGNNQKRHTLKNAGYSIQVAQYVGQVQIMLVENSTRKNLISATTPDGAFKGLDLIVESPDIKVSCLPAPMDQQKLENSSALPSSTVVP